MRDIECAICAGQGEYKVLYQERFNLQDLNEDTYSARRSPDTNHYKVVRCKKCGLVFSTPILDTEEIEKLYRRSKFTYQSITDGLKKTYGFYLKKLENLVPGKENLLEIGCGNGFFLEKALEMGYKNVYGIEPSSEAVKSSPPGIAKNIINDVFGPGYYKESFFDVICMFQTLDHIIDPNEFIKQCRFYLKDGGIILCITHNIDALTSKLLGEKCPMIDIEHIYLFNRKTLRKIFIKHDFDVVNVFDVVNSFPLRYYIQLLPLPKGIKSAGNGLLTKLKMSNITLTMRLGNIGIIARK